MKPCLKGAKYGIIFLVVIIFTIELTAQNSRNNKFEYTGNARVNSKTGVAAALYNVNSRVYAGTPEDIAKQFLDERKTSLGISNISGLKHLETIKSPAGSHVGFLQTYNGIPVFGSETVVSINKENRVTMVVNGNAPISLPKANAASVSKESAIDKAVTFLNAEEKTLVMKPKAELYIYRDSLDNYSLAWKVNYVAQKPQGSWQIFIDANSGEALEFMDISMGYVNGTGSVFKPDPITELQNIYLSDNSPDTAFQAAYKPVTLNDLDNPVGGVYRLWGKYARSESIEYPNTATVTSPTTSFLYNRSQPGFEETSAYYFFNLQRQYIGSLGFSPKWNGQDYIRFDAHAGSSRYVPDGQYICFGEDGDGNVPGVDGAEDLSVILHEYSHALQDAFMVGTGSTAEPYDEIKIGEGTADYLAISYRRTLSTFQPDNVFPWWHNITNILLPQMVRKLEPNYYYPQNWVNKGRYEGGTTWASTLMDIQTAGVSRDIITKLFFTACSYVSPTSLVHDHINAMLQADIDLYSGAHISTLVTAFNNRGFFSNNQLSGTISTSTTWSGYILIMGDITVTNGATLNINPGTQLKFYNGSSLIMNNYGTLNANGSLASPITFDFISPNSTTGNGIKFNSSSMGTINYCQIRNAYRGIYENNWSINITNSAISNCIYGIYLYNSSPTIQNCNIHDNINSGIYLVSSSPYLYNNYIRYNYYGVYCTSSSNPKLGNGSTQGKNLLDNYCGVYCWNNSFPVLGQSSPLSGGYNNFVNSSQNIYNASSGVVYAHNIWWGTTNPANFKISGSGTTSYTNYLTSSVTINPPPLNKAGDMYASENNTPMLSELDKAYEMAASNNLPGARTICLDLINNYPDYSVSYNALNLLKDTYTENDLTAKQDIYKSLFTNKGKKDLYAMTGLVLSRIDKENKVKHIDKVIETFKGEDIVELALFDKFVYYYFELDDKENAREISKSLDEQFPLSAGAVEAHKILGDEEYFKIEPTRKNHKNLNNETTTEYSLSDNYPNPFNPVTKIKYIIPQVSFVTLKVYDILGKEVATLVNEEMPVGIHEVEFNGSDLSSGIYIYRIQAGRFSEVKKFILMK